MRSQIVKGRAPRGGALRQIASSKAPQPGEPGAPPRIVWLPPSRCTEADPSMPRPAPSARSSAILMQRAAAPSRCLETLRAVSAASAGRALPGKATLNAVGDGTGLSGHQLPDARSLMIVGPSRQGILDRRFDKVPHQPKRHERYQPDKHDPAHVKTLLSHA
jgi:hypothetical protein